MFEKTSGNKRLYGHYQTLGDYLKQILVDPRLAYWFPRQTILNPKLFIQDFGDILQSKCLFEGVCISPQEITQSSIIHATGFNHINATLNADIYPNSLRFYYEMSSVIRHIGSKKAMLGRRRISVSCTFTLFLIKLNEVCGYKIPWTLAFKLYKSYYTHVVMSGGKYYNMFWDTYCADKNYKEIEDCGYLVDRFLPQLSVLIKHYNKRPILTLKVFDDLYMDITDVKSGNPVVVDPEPGVSKKNRKTKTPPRRKIFTFEEVFILFPFYCDLDMTECWDKMSELCEEGVKIKEYVTSLASHLDDASLRTPKQTKRRE